MAFLVGVGASDNKSTQAAIDEAFAAANTTLQGHAPSFVLLLASSQTYNQEVLLSTLKTKAPQAKIIGCSTSGEITSVRGALDNSIALLTIYSDQVQFLTAVGSPIQPDPKNAGAYFAQELIKQNTQAPQCAIIFPDGLAGNGADIVRGILSVLGDQFMLAGGSAGDDFLFKKTYQYFDTQVLTDSVVGVGLAGEFKYGIGVRHGWIPIGNSRIATKSVGNILHELDNRPAIEIYEDQFGKDKTPIDNREPFAKLAITYPLGIDLPGEGEFLIRDPLSVDENGAITCAAEIPMGSEVYIMIGSREEAIAAAKHAAEKALKQIGTQPKVAFLFNCIARKKLLLDKKHEEIDQIRKVIGLQTPLIGFYTYGEQAPLGSEIITCSFHNETDVIFLLG